jgi:hypothetical protein
MPPEPQDARLSSDEMIFPEFMQRFGAPAFHKPADVEKLEARRGALPAELVRFWLTIGFGSYANGLFWTHPAALFDDIIEEWTGLSSNQVSLVFRSSFGDLCFWRKDRVYFLDVQLGRVTELARNIGFVFDYVLCREQFLRDVLRSDVHAQSVSRLGPIEPDECYCYVPVRALGGPGTPETVQRAKLREHLALLAQVAGPVTVH